MKTKAFVFVGFMVFAMTGFAETLYIAGTVSDKGFRRSYQGLVHGKDDEHIVVNSKTDLKIYAAEMRGSDSSPSQKSKRSPQSVSSNQNDHQIESIEAAYSPDKKWKKLIENEKLSVSSYIRVEAP
jgi:hypothetical protein